MLTHSRETHLAAYFTLVLVCGVWAAEEKKAVKAREGATVTLDISESLNSAEVLWTFGPESRNMRIATVKGGVAKGDYDEHFRGRLQLDSQTGALSIARLTVNDSGIYRGQIISTNILSQQFHLVVYSAIHPPSITVSAPSCRPVTVECSVKNSRELVLSWYRGKDRLKETSSTDLSSQLSLTLEMESHDGDDYSCVAENPVEEKATKLHTEDACLKNRESSSWCHTEAAIRLVISAVVGITLIALVVDHIRLGR